MPGADTDPLRRLRERIATWPERVRARAVTPTVAPSSLRALFEAHAGFPRPVPLAELIDEVASAFEVGLVQTTHPRHFGLFTPDVRLAGVAGDALTALYNPQVGAAWYAPAASELERVTLAYFRGKLGFDARAFQCFTTGGSEANLTAVLAALTRRFPAVKERGVAGLAERPALYCSVAAHDSFVKIAQITGLGAAAVRRVPVDARDRLDVTALTAALDADARAGWAPFLVVATAGTTATAAIDPLPAVADVARRRELWLHVDAAWGGLGLLTPALRPHLDGIERADSVTWDAHKCLPVPMGAGMYFARDAAASTAAFDVHPAYVPAADTPETEELYRQSIQWSRRCIGSKVFLTCAELGDAGIAGLIDDQVAVAAVLRRALTERELAVVNDSPLPLVCAAHARLDDAGIASLATQVLARGRFWVSTITRPDGRAALRICITSSRTDAADVEALAAELGALVDAG
jgi:glutamate/tyrosine decarboxylase-like PLP-dependent enzyme